MTIPFRPVVGAVAAAALAGGQLVPAPALLASLGATAVHAQSDRTVSCASRGMSRTNCRIPAGAASVTLVRQDSRAVCAEGQS
ncbi:MAG: hypothetical protein ACK4MT_01460 [Thermaurantiacus tibetensis]|uniref:hypothetical protein n=1 Tax=Thermaurantiacus tibetensis TaxID=2759035 RepID=UPI00188FD83B|nr:hypothetical protein [Thermaurantiacus tibetensis]